MESRIEQVRTYIVSPTKLTQVNVSCLEYSATILSREMYMSKQAMHYAFHIDLPNQHYLADNDDDSQYDFPYLYFANNEDDRMSSFSLSYSNVSE